MVIYVDKPPIKISIGRQGENNFRLISFNWDKWKTLFPNGTVSIYFQRPDMTVCYPIVSGVPTSPIAWYPDLTATSVAGEGKLVVKLMDNDVIAKSVTICTGTAVSPDFTGTPPDAWTDWLSEVESYAISVNNSTAAALASQLSASLSEQNAISSKAVAIDQANQAALSAQAAKASEDAIFNGTIPVNALTNTELEALLK